MGLLKLFSPFRYFRKESNASWRCEARSLQIAREAVSWMTIPTSTWWLNGSRSVEVFLRVSGSAPMRWWRWGGCMAGEKEITLVLTCGSGSWTQAVWCCLSFCSQTRMTGRPQIHSCSLMLGHCKLPKCQAGAALPRQPFLFRQS